MKNGPVGDDDIQGQGDELKDGPKKDQGKLTDKTLEESEIDEATLDEILKELEQESSQEECEMPPQTAPVPVEQDEEINLDELFESKDEEDDKKEDKDEEKKDKDDNAKISRPAGTKSSTRSRRWPTGTGSSMKSKMRQPPSCLPPCCTMTALHSANPWSAAGYASRVA